MAFALVSLGAHRNQLMKSICLPIRTWAGYPQLASLSADFLAASFAVLGEGGATFLWTSSKYRKLQ